MPRYGGAPATLPTTLMRAGSLSRSTFDRAALLEIEDRREAGVLVERLAAAAMHVANGGADLRILIGRQILHQEIDEPSVALQDRQQLRRAIARLHRGRRRGRRRRRSGRGGAKSARMSSAIRPWKIREKKARKAYFQRLPWEIIPWIVLGSGFAGSGLGARRSRWYSEATDKPELVARCL